ncbi:MAG: hypothetical protein M3P15_12355 [Actinomycetota bacterium]|nr:hypothetical protein [Actinomycetota bacterium]
MAVSLIWVAATFRTDGLISSFVSASRFVLIAYAAIMLPLALDRHRLRRVVIAAAIAGLVGGVYALYALYHETVSVSTAAGPARVGVTRPGGPFGNYFADGSADHWWVQSAASTNLGFWLGVSLAVVAAIAVRSWRRRQRLLFAGACLSAAAGAFALAATASREAWVGGLLVLALVAALFGRNHSYRGWSLVGLAVTGACAAILVFVPSVRTRLADTVTPGTFSFRTGPQARVHAWAAGLRIGAERFPIGWGIGGVEEHADRFGRATAENMFIQVWMQTSILGVVVFVGWFVLAAIAALRGLRAGSHELLAVFPAVVLLLLFAHGMFGYAIGDPTIQVLIAIALACIAVNSPIVERARL